MTKTARLLKAWRKRKGLKQIDAAKRLKCSQTHVCQIETGAAGPGPDLKARIERVCA